MDSVRVTSEEEGIVDFGDDRDRSSSKESVNLLIGQWISKEPLNLKAMSQALFTSWNLRKAFQLRDIREGKSVVEFLSRRDKEKVLCEGHGILKDNLWYLWSLD